MDWESFDPRTYRGPEEDEVAAFLPPVGFIREWVHYGAHVVDAHAIYHVGNALSALSATVPKHVILPDGDELPANLFCLTIGPSQDSRKSEALKKLSRLFGEVAPDLYMCTPGSGEWLVDEVIAQPRVLIVAEEGGLFFHTSAKADYAQQLRVRLIELADSSPQQRGTVEKGRGKDKKAAKKEAARKEMNPRVSLMMALAPAFLEEHTFSYDWTNGFMARMLLLYGLRRRYYETGRAWPEGKAYFLSWMRSLADVRTTGVCAGTSEEASARFIQWLRSGPKKVHPHAAGVIARAPVHARKAALLAAYDEHLFNSFKVEDPVEAQAFREQPFWVKDHHMKFGCALADVHIASSLHLVDRIPDNEDDRLMRKLAAYIEESPKPMWKVYSYMALTAKRTDQLIATLSSMQKVQTGTGAVGETVLIKRIPGEPPLNPFDTSTQ